MHQVIRIIVDDDACNDTAVAACNRAQYLFNEDLTNDTMFDYCKRMESGHNVAGTDRWRRYADEDIAFRASSERGLREINDAWDETKDEFSNMLVNVVQGVAACDNVDELMDDTSFLFNLKFMGKRKSTSGYLFWDKYDDDTLRAISSKRMKNGMIETIQNDDKSYWVVPLDAHS